ncbi:hypothetical protein BSKO_11423 [Bryopsis sp. KO-2023]|nr:hypothetical protein BSKO_11423 [Bryopsis sp. KO-2023]
MNRPATTFVGCLCPVVKRFARSNAPKAFRQKPRTPPFWGRLHGCVAEDLCCRLICSSRKTSTGGSGGNSFQGLVEPLDKFLSTGLLLAGLAAFILDFTAMVQPAFSFETRSGSIAFRGMPDIEEHLKQGLKHAEVAVDTMIDIVPAGEPSAEESKQYRKLIEEVWEVVDANYMDARDTGFSKKEWATLRDEASAKPLRSRQAAYRAVKEMLARGLRDPYSRLIPLEEFDAMRKYDMTGVGLNVGTADDYVKNTASPLPRNSRGTDGIWVMGLMKDSPADGAGMLQGDRILEIDGRSLENTSPFKASVMLKGDGGDNDSVTLKVQRPEGKIEDLSLKRQSVTIPSPVKGNLQVVGGRRLGFLQLTSFNARAQEDLVKTVKEVESKAATELVLDLRDNRGGLVQEGVEVAKLFLPGDSTIVITQESGAKGQTRIVTPGPPITDLPLTVLVNQNTASASEILAGAIKDNCRGVLAGSKTYGKGLIQSVYALSDGSGLVLTIGKYMTPGMVDIDREGIQPDFKRIPSMKGIETTIQACKASRG